MKRRERIEFKFSKKVTHFFLFPQGDSHAVHRHHNVDFFLLDVFHLELILPREDRQRCINILGGIMAHGGIVAATQIFEDGSLSLMSHAWRKKKHN